MPIVRISSVSRAYVEKLLFRYFAQVLAVEAAEETEDAVLHEQDVVVLGLGVFPAGHDLVELHQPFFDGVLHDDLLRHHDLLLERLEPRVCDARGFELVSGEYFCGEEEDLSGHLFLLQVLLEPGLHPAESDGGVHGVHQLVGFELEGDAVLARGRFLLRGEVGLVSGLYSDRADRDGFLGSRQTELGHESGLSGRTFARPGTCSRAWCRSRTSWSSSRRTG